jgi:hypothetical protein
MTQQWLSSNDQLTTMERDLWQGLDSAIAFISDMASEVAQLHQHHPESDASVMPTSCTVPFSSSLSCDRTVDSRDDVIVADIMSAVDDVNASASSRPEWIDGILDVDGIYDMFGLADAVSLLSAVDGHTKSASNLPGYGTITGVDV